MNMKQRTEMRKCRSCPVEVALVHFKPTHWYAIHLSGGPWDKEGWFFWDDYMQPPKLFWTRNHAEIQAKALRKQYGGRKRRWGNGSQVRVRVVKMKPEKPG